jgi:hypothetical protein
MPATAGAARLGAMSDTQSSLERLEARLDYQAARLDALYRMLETASVLPRPARRGRSDAFFDELFHVEDSPLAREQCEPAKRRRSSRLHIGDATGV